MGVWCIVQLDPEKCQGLNHEAFVRSKINLCVFMRKDCNTLLYVDFMIVLSKSYLVVDVKYKPNAHFELVLRL